MSIGVAIPTYIKHISFLQPLLENIAGSTVKPDIISVSCSSVNVKKYVEFDVYSVPVVIEYTTDTLNPSQNRNRAASNLNTDLITFMDGDDLIHPRRIEYIRDAFINHPEVDVVFHNYDYVELSDRNLPFEDVSYPEIVLNEAKRNSNGIGITIGSHTLHHAHLSVRKAVFARLKFNESPKYKYYEDSIYANTLVSYGYNTAYLGAPLSRYVKNTR